MNALIFLIVAVLDILWWFIIINVVMSWLVAFNVINLHNQFVYSVYQSINGVVDPMLRPIRRMLPNLGGVDISPIFVLLLLMVIRVFVIRDLQPLLLGM